jgi:hypothetical protein
MTELALPALDIPTKTLSFGVYCMELMLFTFMVMERKIPESILQYPAWFHGPMGRFE